MTSGPHAASDDLVLDYLRRRWRWGRDARLDLSGLAQAQRALRLPASLPQRVRLFERLTARPSLLGKRRSQQGATPANVSLTETEKLVARALLGDTARAALAGTLAMDEADVRAALRGLRAFGFLDRGRPVADLRPFLDGLGLTFHTVRLEGEAAFNVP